MYQRSVTEFDRQRRKLEREHSELLAKVTHLTDEVSTTPLPGMHGIDDYVAYRLCSRNASGSSNYPCSSLSWCS